RRGIRCLSRLLGRHHAPVRRQDSHDGCRSGSEGSLMVRIVAVDGSDPAIAHLLHYLQLTILPHDVPKETESGFWWIGYDGVLPVAFAAMHPSSQWSDVGYLSRAGVLSSHRGQGVQRRLLRVRERRARVL